MESEKLIPLAEVRQKQIRGEEGLLIKANSDKEVIILDDETVDGSTARGMIKIYKYTEW